MGSLQSSALFKVQATDGTSTWPAPQPPLTCVKPDFTIGQGYSRRTSYCKSFSYNQNVYESVKAESKPQLKKPIKVQKQIFIENKVTVISIDTVWGVYSLHLIWFLNAQHIHTHIKDDANFSQQAMEKRSWVIPPYRNLVQDAANGASALPAGRWNPRLNFQVCTMWRARDHLNKNIVSCMIYPNTPNTFSLMQSWVWGANCTYVQRPTPPVQKGKC